MRAACLFALCAVAVASAQSRPAAIAFVDLDRWQRSDIEAKWLTYRRSIEADPKLGPKWVAFLAARRDFDLLEWMVIYDGWTNVSSQAQPGLALQQANAPQWIRCAIWCLGSSDGHTQQAAQQALLSDPAKVLGWVNKFPDSKRLGIGPLLARLGDRSEDPGPALPPLDPISVLLPYLDAPKSIEEFGDRLRAEPGKRYVHQVQRAMEGVATSGCCREPYRSKLLALTRHADARIRSTALLSLTRWPPTEIPSVLLLARFTQSESATERRQLLMALSYSDHPRAWLALRQAAFAADSDCWDVAMSRLGDVGKAFDAMVLVKIDDSLSSERRAQQLAQRQRILHRQRATHDDVPQLIEILAFAEHEKHALAPRLREWLRDLVARTTDQALRQRLLDMAAGHVLKGSLGAEQRNMKFTQRVRALARELSE